MWTCIARHTASAQLALALAIAATGCERKARHPDAAAAPPPTVMDRATPPAASAPPLPEAATSSGRAAEARAVLEQVAQRKTTLTALTVRHQSVFVVEADDPPEVMCWGDTMLDDVLTRVQRSLRRGAAITCEHVAGAVPRCAIDSADVHATKRPHRAWVVFASAADAPLQLSGVVEADWTGAAGIATDPVRCSPHPPEFIDDCGT
jgi:hypothetical protein